MQTPPPLPSSPAPVPPTLPKGGDAFSRFIEGYRGLFGRIRSSPKPQPLKWFDRFPVVFGALVLLWPLGLVCVWLTKRFEQTDKLRLTVVALVWGFLPLLNPPAMNAGASNGSEQGASSGNQREHQRQLSKLTSIASDAFGRHEFKRIENSGDAKEAVEFLQVHVQPSSMEAKLVCTHILDFFVTALENKALEGVEFVTFHFHSDLVYQNGKEEKTEVLRIVLSRQMIQSTNWKGYDKYLHIDLVKGQLLSEADDKFFISSLDWQELGWRG